MNQPAAHMFTAEDSNVSNFQGQLAVNLKKDNFRCKLDFLRHCGVKGNWPAGG